LSSFGFQGKRCLTFRNKPSYVFAFIVKRFRVFVRRFNPPSQLLRHKHPCVYLKMRMLNRQQRLNQ
ncbi:hypothetical protein AAHB54_01855, partial [Bacillus cereus]